MTDGSTLRQLALALDGVEAAPHFERTAFKVKRIFVTLAADGRTANFKFTPDERIGKLDLAAALEMAWRHARPTPRKRARAPSP